MIFREKPTDAGYLYRVEDIFGAIEFTSPAPLNAEALDTLTMHVMKTGHAGGYINETIRFTFEKADIWLEDEEEQVIQ